MYLHEMTVAARLESITQIATKLAGVDAHATFMTEWPTEVLPCCRLKPDYCLWVPEPYTDLHVVAPNGRPYPGEVNEWLLRAPGEQARAEGPLTWSMLLSLAHEAGVCPRCHAPLARGKAAGPQHYECGCCGFKFTERLL